MPRKMTKNTKNYLKSSPPPTKILSGENFTSSIIQGLGFGAGSSIAHRIFGPSSHATWRQHTETENKSTEECNKLMKQFMSTCMQPDMTYSNGLSSCDDLRTMVYEHCKTF